MPPLVYGKVRDYLRTLVDEKSDGDRLPTELALSKHLNVNRGTLRRAMLDLENEGFIDRIKGHGTFVRKVARPDQRQRTGANVIGLVLPSLQVPGHIEILKGAEREARTRGFHIWLHNSHLDYHEDRIGLERLAAEPLAGIACCVSLENSYDPEFAELANRVARAGARVVLYDQFALGCDLPHVVMDKRQSGYQAGAFLAMRGHRNILLLCSHGFDSAGDQFQRGFRDALADLGVTPDPERMVAMSVMESRQPAYDAVKNVFADGPGTVSAIAATTASMTYGAWNALRDLGLRPGADVELVGCDLSVNHEMAALPSIEHPFDELGQALVRVLLDGPGADRRHVLIPPRLSWARPGGGEGGQA